MLGQVVVGVVSYRLRDFGPRDLRSRSSRGRTGNHSSPATVPGWC